MQYSTVQCNFENLKNIFCLYCRWFLAREYYNKYKEILHKRHSEEWDEEWNKEFNFIREGKNCARKLRNYITYIIHKHVYDNIRYINDDQTSINILIQFDTKYLDIAANNLNKSFINNDREYIRRCLNELLLIDEINNLTTQSLR